MAEKFVNLKRKEEIGHRTLRINTMKYIHDNFEWNSQRVVQTKYKDKTEYIKYMLKDKKWGGAIEIEAMAELLNLIICVIYEENETQTCFGSNSGVLRNNITIVYVNKNHYKIAVKS